jgi:hypothetical protein
MVMPKIDVTDEAVIDAPPLVVYRAILNEFAGVTSWWLPGIEHKLRGNTPIDCEGGVCDVTAHGAGMSAKFSQRMTKLVEGKSIEMDIAGDFVGTGTWTFEPEDGKTRAKFRVKIRTNRLLFSLVGPFMGDLGKPHSNSMKKGFKALNSYLSKK